MSHPSTISPTRSPAPLRWTLAMAFLLAGCYFEICCAVLSAALLGVLLFRLKNGKLRVRLSWPALCVGLVWLGYTVSFLWAADSSLALWGAVRYLPLPLFALCLMQTEPDERGAMLDDLPLYGAVMTVVSGVLRYIPLFAAIFSVDGRLAGFFAYPNSFAAFLLLGLVRLLSDEYNTDLLGAHLPQKLLGIWRAILAGLLTAGIALAGSRTVYILLIPAMCAAVLVQKRADGRIQRSLPVLIGLAAGAVLGLTVYGTVTLGRAGAISAESSTFLGRLLYWRDVLPVILRHPFGTGYLGYYFMQGSFQTGVYSVRWVHNDFLQLLIDVGWLPAAAAVIAVVQALRSKRMTWGRKVLMLTLLAHCMADFDLEFIALYLVLLLCLDWQAGPEKIIRLPRYALPAAGAILTAFSLWVGLGSTLTYTGHDAAAAAVWPGNTLSQLNFLTQADDVDEMDTLADDILSRNEYAALAWDARARAAYTRGDFAEVIRAKDQAIACARYTLSEYTDYIDLVSVGVTLYTQGGDTDSADYCRQKLAALPGILQDVLDNTSALGWKIADQPDLTLPEEYVQTLAACGVSAESYER